jgi:hypothetical protein
MRLKINKSRTISQMIQEMTKNDVKMCWPKLGSLKDALYIKEAILEWRHRVRLIPFLLHSHSTKPVLMRNNSRFGIEF